MLMLENKIRKIIRKILKEAIDNEKDKSAFSGGDVVFNDEEDERKEREEKFAKFKKEKLMREKRKEVLYKKGIKKAEEEKKEALLGDGFDPSEIISIEDFKSDEYFGRKSDQEGTKRIKPGVTYTNTAGNDEKKKIALAYLWPFLPPGSSINDIGRDQKTQNSLIVRYAKANGFKKKRKDYTSTKDYYDAAHEIATTGTKKYAVGRYVGTGHGGKSNTIAFDISPGEISLASLKQRILNFNKHMGELVKFQGFKTDYNRSIVEAQGIIHLGLNLENVRVKEYDDKLFYKLSQDELIKIKNKYYGDFDKSFPEAGKTDVLSGDDIA